MTLGRLTLARHNYIRTKTIVQAHARLVAVQAVIPLARAWGEDEVPDTVGLRFVVPVRSPTLRPVVARRSGAKADPLAYQFPTVEDGARGVKFIEAALESNPKSGAWVDAKLAL